MNITDKGAIKLKTHQCQEKLPGIAPHSRGGLDGVSELSRAPLYHAHSSHRTCTGTVNETNPTGKDALSHPYLSFKAIARPSMNVCRPRPVSRLTNQLFFRNGGVDEVCGSRSALLKRMKVSSLINGSIVGG